MRPLHASRFHELQAAAILYQLRRRASHALLAPSNALQCVQQGDLQYASRVEVESQQIKSLEQLRASCQRPESSSAALGACLCACTKQQTPPNPLWRQRRRMLKHLLTVIRATDVCAQVMDTTKAECLCAMSDTRVYVATETRWAFCGTRESDPLETSAAGGPKDMPRTFIHASASVGEWMATT